MTARERMDRELRTKRGRAFYRQRGAAVEPVFGQMKDRQGADRFSMRGLARCRGEWQLDAAVHNLRKLHREFVRYAENRGNVGVTRPEGGLIAARRSGGKPLSERARLRVTCHRGLSDSLLMVTIFWLLRRSIPVDPLEPGAWLAANTKTIALALNLVPFAGVAFLWFIGVLRDRLGQQEDCFFATVFFGSA